MGVGSLVLGVISTGWALLGGMWIATLIGLVGVALGLIGIKRKSMGAPIGLLLSVNGVAWGLLYMALEEGLDPIADILGMI